MKMRSNIIDRILGEIPPQRLLELDREFIEDFAYNRWLEEQGKEYGTSTSITLDIAREAGFNPIGICWYGGEETLIFKTSKEANLAYKKLEREQGRVFAYWYSKKDFEKQEKYYQPTEIQWLLDEVSVFSNNSAPNQWKSIAELDLPNDALESEIKHQFKDEK